MPFVPQYLFTDFVDSGRKFWYGKGFNYLNSIAAKQRRHAVTLATALAKERDGYYDLVVRPVVSRMIGPCHWENACIPSHVVCRASRNGLWVDGCSTVV